MRGFADGELKFIESMLQEDEKNYHAWQYRQWLIKTYSLWQDELNFTESLIKDDLRNNSAWNQRYFVISHTTEFTEEVMLREVLYTLEIIDRDVYNESPWNYLRGILQNLNSISQYELPEPYNCSMLQHIRNLLTSRTRVSPYLALFAVEVFEELLSTDESILSLELSPLLEKMETVDDTVRRNYWKFTRLRLSNEYEKQAAATDP